MNNIDREFIDAGRRAHILELPVFTLFRCGWRTPSGNVQGQTYWRVGDGLAPTSRDSHAIDILRRAVSGGYDKPWAIEILATPSDTPRMFDVIVECPGCRTDGSSGLRGHFADCIYNPMSESFVG